MTLPFVLAALFFFMSTNDAYSNNTTADKPLRSGHSGLTMAAGDNANNDLRSPFEIITGKITDNSGAPLAGVSVKVKNKSQGTFTDVSGNYSVDASVGDTLVFSSIGYVTQEIPVGNSSQISVRLVTQDLLMNAVVVTALGVNRQEKSLAYASQIVKGDEVNDVKADNLMNALNGKVAGVTITPSSSGVGGSVKVIMRGNKNAFGSNQPLYVIDGIPMANTSNANGQPNGTYGGGTDGGDGISNLNPDDIASISFLEGASAAALYGSQAANGVVLITTKKGVAGQARVNLTSSITSNTISYKPKFQNEYGETPNGNQSWGAKLSTPYNHDNLADFFQTGYNATNAINFTAGNNMAQTYFSYANTTSNGVVPTNRLERHNFTFREDAHFLNNKLTLSVNTNYISQEIKNTQPQGLYLNPVTGLYLFPRGVDITQYKTNYGVPVPSRNGLLTQNWVANEDVQSNPWWIIYKDPNIANRNRIIINATAKYSFNNWLNLQVRGNTDRVADTYEQDMYAGSNPVNTVGVNGSFSGNSQTMTQTYADAILNFNVPFKTDEFKISGLVGTSITDNKIVGQTFGAGTGLAIPNVFILQNVLTSASSPVSTLPEDHNQVQSIFGSLSLNYKQWAYLDLTGRNDWSSNLAFTNNESYFYPSVGFSFILSEIAKLPEFINFAKIRGSFAEVASPVPQYITHPINYIASGGSVTFNTVEPNPELKPTNTRSYEAGIDLQMFDNRLIFNYTWYKSNTLNQFIQYTPAASTGFTVGYLNAGNIQNTGNEITVSYKVLKDRQLNWTSSLNFSNNKNTILELNPAAPDAPIWLTAYSPNAYGSALVKGGSWADIYGVKFQRNAQGQIMLNDADAPINNNTFVKVGNPNPDWQMGWSNDFTFHNFNLSFLVDGKFGGQVLSMTQMMLDSYGTSIESGEARDKGSIAINGIDPDNHAVTSVDPQSWYATIGGRSGIAEAYIYSATVVRLRQVSLGYNFPIKPGFVKDLRLSLIGSNLIYFSRKAPYDPDLTMSTGNGMSGVDVFTVPTTRNIGAQLNVTF